MSLRSTRTAVSLVSAARASADARNAMSDQMTNTAVALSPTLIQARLSRRRIPFIVQESTPREELSMQLS